MRTLRSAKVQQVQNVQFHNGTNKCKSATLYISCTFAQVLGKFLAPLKVRLIYNLGVQYEKTK